MNYDERVSKASELMKANGIDVMVLSRSSESKSLYYLTGVDRYCATYIIHKDCSNTLLILDQDMIDEEKKAYADEMETFSTAKSHYQAIIEAVKKGGLKSGVIGVEKSFLRQNFYETLRETLPQTFKIVDAQKITGQMRLIKTEDEIHLIRKASTIASKTIESTTELVKSGIKENEISATVEYELRKNGAEDTSASTLIASGYRTKSAHPPSCNRKLMEGDLVLIDIHPRLQGYCSDLASTLIVESKNPKLEKQLTEFHNLRDEIIQTSKIGEKISNIHLRFQQSIKKLGFNFPQTPFFNNIHGIGVAANDPPSFWYPYDLDLQTGMVFAFAQAPSQMSQNENAGIRFEDTYLVADKKIEKLTTYQN